mgnify:CR=1 FL=1
MRYERSLAITKRHGKVIALVRTGGYSSPLLAEKLKVSEQTIYRDIDFLKEQGYPIRSVRIAKGWAYQMARDVAAAPHGARSAS